MGFKRKIGRGALVAVVLVCAAPVGAASPREPLIVTSLPEPELLSANGTIDNSGPDMGMQQFASAISRATSEEQAAIAARCKSVTTIPNGGAGRAAWETNCRYVRR